MIDADEGPPRAGSGVEAVTRALALLRCFSGDEGSLSLTELSKRSGYYKSTVLRLAISLEQAGFLVRRTDKMFGLGPELMRLGALYARTFRLEDHVRPVLRDLLAVAGESASFFRREGAGRVCLFRVDSAHAIRDHVREGDMLSVDKGAAGHVLRHFDGGQSTVSPIDLPIVSFGERDAETAAAAVPVFASDGLVGALGVSGPRMRFTPDRIIAMRPALLHAGASLSTTLGGGAHWSRLARSGSAP